MTSGNKNDEQYAAWHGFHLLQSSRMDLQVEQTSCRGLEGKVVERNPTDVYCSFSHTPWPGVLYVDLFFMQK